MKAGQKISLGDLVEMSAKDSEVNSNAEFSSGKAKPSQHFIFRVFAYHCWIDQAEQRNCCLQLKYQELSELSASESMIRGLIVLPVTVNPAVSSCN